MILIIITIIIIVMMIIIIIILQYISSNSVPLVENLLTNFCLFQILGSYLFFKRKMNINFLG